MNSHTIVEPDRPVYAGFFGMNEGPFDLTPNPRFLFLSARQREALSNLRYGLAQPKGLTLLLGGPGTGKTTLLRTAIATLQSPASRYALLSNPTLERAEFYEYLARELGLSEGATSSKARFLFELEEQVESRRAVGGLTVLIIDEAQSLPDALLEEIRLLGNIETTTTKLLSVVLSGQPELADRLNEVSLRQLKQRVALRCELAALSLEETAAYISGRLRIAGAQPQEVFTKESVIAIHRAAQGIPRTINVLCENALIGGFAAQVKPVPVEIVSEVCRDFDVEGRGMAQPAASGDNSTAPPGRPTQGTSRLLPSPSTAPERPLFGAVGQEPKRRFFFF